MQDIKLSKLHFMAIDNYLIQNTQLKTLKLVGVQMGYDNLKHIAGSIEVN